MQQAAKYLQHADLGLYDYYLVAYADVVVNEKIGAQQALFADKYLHNPPSEKPAITIASFMAFEAMEETVLRYTQRICGLQAGFEVTLNNYSGLPPHTIYLRVQNPQPFVRLRKELSVVNDYVTSCLCPPLKFYSKPHLTMIAGLSEKIYLKAMMDYSQKTFHETFIVDQLVLLRKTSGYDTCKILYIFSLLPLNELSRQVI